MTIDFSTITIYEVLALFLSTIAILIPIIQWGWQKWIVKPVLKHYITGRAYLFINRSGSYMRIEGVFEAQRKPVSVKKVTIKVIRKKDEKALNLIWSTFTSPINQHIIGNIASATEIAHPFRIEADSIMCAFTEFADFYDSSSKIFQPYYDALFQDTCKIVKNNLSYDDLYPKYIEMQSFVDARNALEKELFWEIGKYNIIMEVEYGKSKAEFTYEFLVEADNYARLKQNLEETLYVPLKDAYRVPYSFQTVCVEPREINSR